MFYSINSKQFGTELKRIRKNLSYSQPYVSKTAKISVDGLRKIEHGYVTPRFETLIKLSELYKTNLLETLMNYSRVPNLVDAYNDFQFHIDTENAQKINALAKSVEKSLQKNIENGIILIEEVKQFILFCEASELYIKNTKDSLALSKSIIIKALELTIDNFNVSLIEQYKYNYFEIRLLNLLSLTEQRLNNHKFSISILKTLINKTGDEIKTIHSIKNMNLLYFNLAYSYYEIGNHKECIKYADRGIEFSIEHSRFNEMHLLYYRKGISEYYLGIDSYMNSLIKSVTLLEIMKNPLADTYRKITKDKYGIVIK